MARHSGGALLAPLGNERVAGEDLEDRIERVKFSGVTWAKDGSGFYYSRYDVPENPDRIQGAGLLVNGHFGARGLGDDARRQLGATITGDLVDGSVAELGKHKSGTLAFSWEDDQRRTRHGLLTWSMADVRLVVGLDHPVPVGLGTL